MYKAFFFLTLFMSCQQAGSVYSNKATIQPAVEQQKTLTQKVFEKGSWEHFLQNLSYTFGPILDYKGRPVADQQKHFAILPFDVGSRDLQQCADALMRLRAEYLFAQKRFDEIAFHFTNKILYSFNQYCNGIRPVNNGDKLEKRKNDCERSKVALRQYLDIVYTYAGTLSLSAELKQSQDFGVGIIIIKGGSPGHCCIIIDEATDEDGTKYFRLAEGYTPAQSIYILQNLNASTPDPWYRLNKEEIETTSYRFDRYKLGKFQ